MEKVTKRLDRLYMKKLRNNATVPCRGTNSAAGYDLSSTKDLIISGKGKGEVKTRLAIAIPEGTYVKIAPRSRSAVKQFIDMGVGIVDTDYHGDVGVVLFNHTDDEFRVFQGDWIAQLILKRIKTPAVEVAGELDNTSRGAVGFGSTGILLVSGKNFGNGCTRNIRKQSTNANLPSPSLKTHSESIL